MIVGEPEQNIYNMSAYESVGIRAVVLSLASIENITFTSKLVARFSARMRLTEPSAGVTCSCAVSGWKAKTSSSITLNRGVELMSTPRSEAAY